MIGVIADDLTGAAEIGAVGLRHKLRAEVVLAGEPSGEADLVCLDTDSRACAPGEAAERAARAARRMRQHRAGWLYKKTDSVLRGNVTPEIEAIVAALGLDGVLLVPANPSLGRTIVGGHYFVRGQLVHETEFARDPKYPRLSSHVRELVGTPATLPLLVRRAEEGLPERGIVIGDAANLTDLRQWAALRQHGWLMAGGADFFGALLTEETAGGISQATSESAHLPLPRRGGEGRRVGERIEEEPRTSNALLTLRLSPSEGERGETDCRPAKELFVCGSASEVTRDFVARQKARRVRMFSLPPEVASGGSFEAGRLTSLVDEVVAGLKGADRVILHISLPPMKDLAIAEILALHLVRVAEQVIPLAGVGHVFAEGGATAVGLARQMAWHRFQVTAELAPGVVTLSPHGGSFTLLTIKPGSYPWPEGIVAGRAP